MRLLVALLAVSLSDCTLTQAKVAAWSGVTLDLVTTQIALNSGLPEANPIMAWTGEPVMFSAIGSGLLLGGAAWIERYDERGATWFYRWTAFARGAMGIWNGVQVIKHRNREDPVDKRKRRSAPMIGVRLVF